MNVKDFKRKFPEYAAQYHWAHVSSELNEHRDIQTYRILHVLFVLT